MVELHWYNTRAKVENIHAIHARKCFPHDHAPDNDDDFRMFAVYKGNLWHGYFILHASSNLMLHDGQSVSGFRASF